MAPPPYCGQVASSDRPAGVASSTCARHAGYSGADQRLTLCTLPGTMLADGQCPVKSALQPIEAIEAASQGSAAATSGCLHAMATAGAG